MNQPNTAADVANHALTSLENGLEKLFDTGREISQVIISKMPHVWHGLVEYHRVLAKSELFVNIIIILFCVLSFTAGVYFFIKGIKASNSPEFMHRDWPVFLCIISSVTCVASVIFGVSQLQDLPQNIARAAVPERAAAIDMIRAARGDINSHGDIN